MTEQLFSIQIHKITIEDDLHCSWDCESMGVGLCYSAHRQWCNAFGGTELPYDLENKNRNPFRCKQCVKEAMKKEKARSMFKNIFEETFEK